MAKPRPGQKITAHQDQKSLIETDRYGHFNVLIQVLQAGAEAILCLLPLE